nr:hypothetical protein [Tenacibaculum finnmarkense]
MKTFQKIILSTLSVLAIGCQNEDEPVKKIINTNVNFSYKTSIKIGGEGASEISAFDKISKKLFTVNVESQEISINDISDLNNPKKEKINLTAYGSPNSVAVLDGKLAVAVEATIKQNAGKILLYNTADNKLISQFTVGALPDMLAFSPDGKTIVSANEGEPNDDYTNDQKEL